MNVGVSFRDKVIGVQGVPQRERVDLMEKDLAKLTLVKGNRLLPMFYFDNRVI